MLEKKTLTTIIVHFALFCRSLCATQPVDLQKVDDSSVIIEPDSLSRTANDRGADRVTRAKAVFRMFTCYINAGDDVMRLRSLFKETNWISNSSMVRILSASGWLPIEWDRNVYCLELFPKQGRKKWFIYIRTSEDYDFSPDNKQIEMNHKSFPSIRTTKVVRIVSLALCEYEESDLFPRIICV